MKSIIRNIFIASTVGVLSLQQLSAQRRLSLPESVTLAEQNNPEIGISKFEIEKSKQDRVIARSLFLPTVAANGQLAHYFQLNPFFGFGESTPNGKIPYGRFGGEDQFVAFVSAVQPLYNPQAFPRTRYARLKEEESQVLVNAKRNETLSKVKQTYWQILVLEERIKLQRESISRNNRVLQDARSLFVQGKGLRVDTLRAYTAVKNLEPDLLKLNFAVETSKLRLKSFIGIDSLQDILLTDSLLLPSPSSIPAEEDVYQAAKNNNPNYKLLALREQTSEQQTGIASAARLPVVSAVAQYQLQSQTNNFEYGNGYYPSSSFVGLQVSIPVFAGLGNQAKVRQARISKEQSVLTSKHAYDELHAIVHQVVADSHESLARLKTSADVKETAALSYDIVQYRYKRGISSRLELNDAELELSTAQSNYLEAVYDYLTARIVLDNLVGQVE